MKIVIASLMLLVLSSSLNCLKITSYLKNKSSDKQNLVENVIIEKDTPVTSINNVDSIEFARFAQVNQDLPANFETPTMVPSLGTGDRFNVKGRVASLNTPVLQPLDQYDVLYKNHHDYYDKDKRAYVLDNHFAQNENYLLNQFSEAITKGINWNPELEHVDDFKTSPKFSIELNNVPKIFPDAVKTSLNYGEMKADNQGVMRTATDPYKQIFGSRDV